MLKDTEGVVVRFNTDADAGTRTRCNPSKRLHRNGSMIGDSVRTCRPTAPAPGPNKPYFALPGFRFYVGTLAAAACWGHAGLGKHRSILTHPFIPIVLGSHRKVRVVCLPRMGFEGNSPVHLKLHLWLMLWPAAWMASSYMRRKRRPRRDTR